jgi:predicted nucleotidyltransferase
MTSARERHVLEIFAARAREHFPDADIWAFGSRVRGDASEGSDLDVCVVEGLKHADRQTIRYIAWEVGFEHEMFVSTVIYSKNEFEHGPYSESPLVLNIL